MLRFFLLHGAAVAATADNSALQRGDVRVFSGSAKITFACNGSAFYDIFVPSIFAANAVVNVHDGASSIVPMELPLHSASNYCVDAVANVAAVVTHRRHALPCNLFNSTTIDVGSTTPFGVAFAAPFFCRNETNMDNGVLFVPHSRLGAWAGFGKSYWPLLYVAVGAALVNRLSKYRYKHNLPLLTVTAMPVVAFFLLDVARSIVLMTHSSFSPNSAVEHKRAAILIACRATLYWWCICGIAFAAKKYALLSVCTLTVAASLGLVLGVANGYVPAILLGAALIACKPQLIIPKSSAVRWDSLMWAILIAVYAVLTAVYSESVDRTCPLTFNNQNEIVNAPAAASSVFLAAAALSYNSWAPLRLYSLSLAIASFGFWWTQCNSWNRVDITLVSVIPLVVCEACAKPFRKQPHSKQRVNFSAQQYKMTAVVYVAIIIYIAVALSQDGYSVPMYEATAISATFIIVLLSVSIISGLSMVTMSAKQTVAAVLVLLAAACALWISAGNRYRSRRWYQATAVGHFLAGVSMYIAALDKSIFISNA
jgi:hypothetical protein